MTKTVVITVDEGVTNADHIPNGIEVLILDYDQFECGDGDVDSLIQQIEASHLSPKLRTYYEDEVRAAAK